MILHNTSGELSKFQQSAPLILEGSDRQKWLEDGENTLSDITQMPIDLELSSHTVSPSISDLTANSGDLISPAAASDQFGNYTLFS